MYYAYVRNDNYYLICYGKVIDKQKGYFDTFPVVTGIMT